MIARKKWQMPKHFCGLPFDLSTLIFWRLVVFFKEVLRRFHILQKSFKNILLKLVPSNCQLKHQGQVSKPILTFFNRVVVTSKVNQYPCQTFNDLLEQ